MMTQAGREALDWFRRLDGYVDGGQLELPWGGRSPRVLTRGYQRFRLEPRGDDVNPIVANRTKGEGEPEGDLLQLLLFDLNEEEDR